MKKMERVRRSEEERNTINNKKQRSNLYRMKINQSKTK